MTDLITYLLQERHRIPNQVMIDCLLLAQLAPSPGERQSVASLLLVMDAATQSSLSQRLGKLKRHGLISYDAGIVGDAGYRITRVGPAAG